ncbi:neuropeptide FF receptor 1-like [Octopus bimaculoides]|uniref:G-protein coupled receptors family 1 profile domain-containing protein n=2 Tax=Octopus TaxID=6643 RepID=A0A0L8GJ23_OCTBM|nr:neuropeptide FF receptor 1-like [Octopus sinensis]XP_052828052.1 neuropeptide FF receptor 1-like [Octopus bimaculoides]
MSYQRRTLPPPYYPFRFNKTYLDYRYRYDPQYETKDNGPFSIFDNTADQPSDTVIITDRSIAGCVCLLNFVLLLALCCVKAKDKKLFRLHLVNLTLISIFTGVVILAYALFVKVQGVNRFDKLTCKIFTFAKSVLNDALPLCLLEIHLDRFFCLISPDTYRHPVHRAIGAIMVFMPWVVGMAMTLPEVIMQDVTLPLANDRSLFGCKLNDSTNMHHLTQIVRYIPSGLVVISFLLTLIAVIVLLCPHCSPDRDDRGSLLNSMVALLLVDVFFFLMQMITRTISLVAAICPTGECTRGYIYIIHQSLLSKWLHSANPGLNPILWLCDRDIRRGYQALCCLECITKKKRRTG